MMRKILSVSKIFVFYKHLTPVHNSNTLILLRYLQASSNCGILLSYTCDWQFSSKMNMGRRHCALQVLQLCDPLKICRVAQTTMSSFSPGELITAHMENSLMINTCCCSLLSISDGCWFVSDVFSSSLSPSGLPPSSSSLQMSKIH